MHTRDRFDDLNGEVKKMAVLATYVSEWDGEKLESSETTASVPVTREFALCGCLTKDD